MNGQPRPTVALVLGSGGARGLAHIGVLRWLDEHDFDIRVISGASIGALIGGFYAAGTLDIYTRWVRALRQRDVLRLMDFAFSRGGLIGGDRVMGTLERLLGDANIEDLPIRFTAVATDLESQKEVWLQRGSLFRAIRASISVPAVFAPVTWQGRLLVDGGLLNPIPIAPTLSAHTDLTIAVNLGGEPRDVARETQTRPPLENRVKTNNYQARIDAFLDELLERFKERDEERINMYNIVIRSFDAMQITIARFKQAAYTPDHVVDIPANAARLLEFHRADEMIALGYAEAERVLGPIAAGRRREAERR